MTDYIETFTGVAFRPLDPNPADICIEDIAHALAHQCRFSGHTRRFYSVAEHSVRVAELLEAQGHTPDVLLWGLLHDASEAYLVDIPTPLKQSPMFDAYRLAEFVLNRAIAERFRVPALGIGHWHVGQADAVLLATEARDLMPYRPEHWGTLTAEPLEDVIVPWSPRTAERNFLRTYNRLRRV